MAAPDEPMPERALLRAVLRQTVADLRTFVQAQEELAADGVPPTPDTWIAAPLDEHMAPPASAGPGATGERPEREDTPRVDRHPNAPPPETQAPLAQRRRVARPAQPQSGSTLSAFNDLAGVGGPPPIPQIPLAKRPPSLDAVREALGPCTRCPLHERRTNIVFGVGNPTARLLFVGEGPGAKEDAQGIPFVGPAGDLLTRIIGAMGLQRDDVYIANIVKCRPPGNRDPKPDEVAQCEPFLIDQITVIQPEVIVTLGRIATHALLKIRTPITRLRGHWQEYRGIPVMPTLHPAYLLRQPAAKRHVWADIQDVMRRLGAAPSDG